VVHKELFVLGHGVDDGLGIFRRQKKIWKSFDINIVFFYSHRDEEQVAAGLFSLFAGSLYTLKDMCRFLLFIKCLNSVVGDRVLASGFGIPLKVSFMLFHVHVKTCYFMYMLKHPTLCTYFTMFSCPRRFAIDRKEFPGAWEHWDRNVTVHTDGR
jgi:hypothetical protein